MAKYKEKPIEVNPLDKRTFKRGGGEFTCFFNEIDIPNEELKSTIREACDVLDSFRFKLRLSGMDKGAIIEALATQYREIKLYKGWASMEPAVETNGITVLEKVTPLQKGAGRLLTGILNRKWATKHYDNSHSMVKLSKGLDAVKLLDVNLDNVVDIILIYTEDGIESFSEAKELHGGERVDYTRYPNYYSLFTVFKYAQLLGCKVFNLGKKGFKVNLENFLNENFDRTKSSIPEIGKKPYTSIPKWYDRPLIELFNENAGATPQANDNANTYSGDNSSNNVSSNPVKEINIPDPTPTTPSVNPTPSTPPASPASNPTTIPNTVPVPNPVREPSTVDSIQIPSNGYEDVEF